DADAIAPAKWEISEFRERLSRFRRPALGIESERVGKVARVAMHNIRRHGHDRLRPDAVAAKLVLLLCGARNEPGGRIKTHRFGHDHLGVAQPWRVFKSRHSTAEHRVEFGV